MLSCLLTDLGQLAKLCDIVEKILKNNFALVSEESILLGGELASFSGLVSPAARLVEIVRRGLLDLDIIFLVYARITDNQFLQTKSQFVVTGLIGGGQTGAVSGSLRWTERRGIALGLAILMASTFADIGSIASTVRPWCLILVADGMMRHLCGW